MKRDMDLLRTILLRIEESPVDESAVTWLLIDGFDEATVAAHVELLKEAGLVDAYVMRADGTGPLRARPFRLTWDGHEFLGAIADDSVWTQTKATLSQRLGSVH